MPSDAINRSALRRLCATLRDPSSWPDGFEWDYGLCSHCAMGLSYAIGLVPPYGDYVDMATALGIPDVESSRIFLGMSILRNCSDDSITPSMVADALEELLSSEVSG